MTSKPPSNFLHEHNLIWTNWTTCSATSQHEGGL